MLEHPLLPKQRYGYKVLFAEKCTKNPKELGLFAFYYVLGLMSIVSSARLGGR